MSHWLKFAKRKKTKRDNPYCHSSWTPAGIFMAFIFTGHSNKTIITSRLWEDVCWVIAKHVWADYSITSYRWCRRFALPEPSSCAACSRFVSSGTKHFRSTSAGNAQFLQRSRLWNPNTACSERCVLLSNAAQDTKSHMLRGTLL